MAESQRHPSPGILSLISFVSHLAGAALFRALTYPIHSRRAPTFRKDVLFAAIRASISSMTIPQARYLLPNTTQAYLKLCKAKNLEPQLVEIPAEGINSENVVRGGWIGNPDTADVVVLYFHGGAYTQYATDGCYEWWLRWMKENNETHRSVSVLVLAYSVAPEHAYPTQLREASAALAYLVNTKRRSPSDIMISGDSAGGHLGLSLLSHLLHPNPAVTEVKLNKPLRGALLFSTWLPFRTDFPSFTTNRESDMLIPEARRWAAMYLGKSNPKNIEEDPGPLVGDQWSDPLSNGPEWWKGLHTVVADILDWRGADEVLTDPIKELDEKIVQGWVGGGGEDGRVVSMETPKHAHIAPIAGVMMDPQKTEGQFAVEEWLKARLEK